ncbi:MAG: molybdopterin-dependent oxidoreductase [Deltaproteobacteria bacterium]|nr:molybdopterin-dependent oxidoreductase [Deltaproteobacteria bacterium]
MPRETHPSICRFCHANCGILVEVEDGRPVRVTGDPENPAYFGFTCAKGRRLPDQHAHPDRLLHSQKRGEDGRFTPIASEAAMDEIAARIGEIVKRHGPRAVALYPGTYSGPHPASIPAGVGFMLALGSKMVFTSAAIDQPGKHVANAIHGRWLGGSHVFDESDVWMLVGNNPLISMSGGIPPSNPSRRLRRAKARGLSLIVIDPRKTEVARFADLFLQPRAGEDPAILAAMLHVVIREGLYDSAFLLENVAGFEALSNAVADCTPAWAAARAGLDPFEIVAAARLFARGPRGCAVAGTGPNMAPHGNLTEYLLLCLNTLCGRWRRAGERVPNPGALLPPALGKAQASGPRPGWGKGESLRSRPLGNSAAGLPTAALSDEILYEGDERIRVLVCLGSNPVAAWPDQRKAIAAMKKLELLVCLDPKLGATSGLAHYVIAPKLSLEVPGLSVSSEGVEQTYVAHGYPEPYAQYTKAIVAPPPGADVIEEWEFFHGLCRRMGLPLTCYPLRAEAGVLRGRREAFALDMQKKPSTDEDLAALMNGSRVPLDEIKRHPHGAIFDAEQAARPGTPFAPKPEHAVVAPADPGNTDRLDVANADMLRELAGIRRAPLPPVLEGAPHATPPVFQLISRRLPNVYNSSGRDLEALQKGRTWNPAFLHPDDLAMLGLADGDRIEIASSHDSILGIAEAAPELRRGIVSMAHCYGDGPENDDKLRELGSSTGRLIDNLRDFDPYTGIPRMSAIDVTIRKA